MNIQKFILLIFFKSALSQILQQCRTQNKYLDIELQTCGNCQQQCDACNDQQTCEICQPSFFYDYYSGNCLSQCQFGGSQQEFFQVCIECQIQNCDICEYEGTQCKQCVEGWNLAEDKLSCQKHECLNNNYLYYNQASDQCTTNCPEYANDYDKTCVNLRKFSQIKTFGSRNQIKQDNINEIYYYQKIDQSSIVIAISNTNAVFYSYPELISLNQINLLTKYEQTLLNKQTIYLFSQASVQKLDLEMSEISLVYQTSSCEFFSFSESFAYYYYSLKINVINLLTSNVVIYNFLYKLQLNFMPFQFNDHSFPPPPPPNPMIPSPPQVPPNSNNSVSSQPPEIPLPPIIDQIGCLIFPAIQNLGVQITKQILNLIQKNALNDSLFASQPQTQAINPQIKQYFDLKSTNKTVFVDQNNSIWFIDWNKTAAIYQVDRVDKDIQILDCFEYNKQARFVLIKPDIYDGIYQSAIICANLIFDQTINIYVFLYEQPRFVKMTSQIIDHQIINNFNSIILSSLEGYEIVNISAQISQQATSSDQNNSSLIYNDYIPNIGNFQVINNDLIMISQQYFGTINLVLYNTIKRANQAIITGNYQQSKISNLVLSVSKKYLKLVIKSLYSVGNINLQVFDLKTFQYQKLQQTSIIASNDISFIASYNSQFMLYNFTDLSSVNLLFPFSAIIMNSNLLYFQGKTYTIIQSIQKQILLYDVYSQQIVQILLQASTENQYKILKQNQLVLFQSENQIINLKTFQFQSSVMLASQSQIQFFDFNTNEQILNGIPFSSDSFSIVQLINKRQLLVRFDQSQFAILDLQFNLNYMFLNQTQVIYASQIDVFISVDQNKQILFYRGSDYKIQKLNLFLINGKPQISYETIIQSKNSIILTQKTQTQQISYLYNYYTQQLCQLQFQDIAYYNSIDAYSLIQQDDIIIIFLKVSYSLIQILDNSQYQILKYQSYGDEFLQLYLPGLTYYNNQNQYIIQLFRDNQVIASRTVLSIYDLNLVQNCQFTFSSSQQYLHITKYSKFVTMNQSTLSVIDYANCQIQNTPLYGIQFQQQAIRQNPRFIFLENDLDLIMIISQDRLNLFQFSTLMYLGSLDYQNYGLYPIVLYASSSNSLVIIQNLYVQIFDLWTCLFASLHNNYLNSYNSNFLYYHNQKLILIYRYNSGVLNIHSSNTQEILTQHKFQGSQFATKFEVQLFNLTSNTILAIISQQELIVYDFVKNQQTKYVSQSFNCKLISYFELSIICLESSNTLKKFNKNSLDFDIVATSNSISFQVTQLYALNNQIVALFDDLGNVAFLNTSLIQISPQIQVSSQLNKIKLYEIYIVIQTQSQYITILQLDPITGVKNITQVTKFQFANQSILDFTVLQYSQSSCIIIATNLETQAFYINSNTLIGNLPVSCQNVQFVVENMFIIILFNDVHLIYMNQQYSFLLESYQNLDNPIIYFTELLYTDKQKQILSQINFKCFSNQNLFDISYQVQQNNINTYYMQINYQQTSNIYINQNQHQDLQSRIYYQYLQLAKYKIQMDSDYSNLIKIQIFYDIFTKNSVIEYNFEKKQSQIQRKGIAYLSNNNFILPQFHHLTFQTINLWVQSQETRIELNPNSNLKTLIINDAEFVFHSNTQIQISNSNRLILDQLTIGNQPSNITNKYYFIVQNVTNVYIKNLTIQNFDMIDQTLFLFETVTNINLENLNLINLNLRGYLFLFNECENIQIQNILVKNIKLNKGSIFSIIKADKVIINQLNATQISRYLISPPQRNLQQGSNLLKQQFINKEPTALISFQGCQSVIIQNTKAQYFQDICLVYADHYQIDKTQMYFLSDIKIVNFQAQNFVFSGNGFGEQILQITSIQTLLQFFNFSQISNNNSLIQLNPLERVTIDNSRFENINLQSGSVIYFLQGELVIMSSNFTNINSTAFPSAINVLQGDLIQIYNCNFLNLTNDVQFLNRQNSLLQYQGGAIKLQNTNITKIQQSLFKNCISLGPAGAIYSFQSKQKAIFEISMTQFIENQSKLDSGGALYFLSQSGINITQSYFTRNLAQKSQGGAIYFESSSLIAFKQSNFSLNQADIGGSIYYSATNQNFFKLQTLLKNQILFEKNEATFYGQNIGSIPFWIGVTHKPSVEKLRIVQQYNIYNISSGNYMDQPLYLNFIDEEGNPFNFFGPQSLNTMRKEFSLQLYFQNNSQIIIQQGINAQLNQTIGLFQLNFQSIYKISQKQKIYIISNQIQQDSQLYLALELQYRDCIKGETIQEKDDFIQCNQCVQGRYSLKIPDMQKDINNIECTSCPDSARFCQGSQIILKDGYWRENDSTDKIYQCLLNSCSFENPNNKNGCLEGFVGPLCNSCDSKASVWKHQYGLKGLNCYVCSEWIEQYLYFSIYFALYFFYIAYSHHTMIKSKITMYKLIIFKKIDLFITSKSSSQGKDFSLWFKIFINYLQILSCLLSFNIAVPSFLNVSLNLFGDPIQLTVTSFDCLFKMSDQYPVWLNRIVTQVVSMIVIYFLINLSLILISIKQHKDRKKALAQIPNIARMTFIFIYIFYQPSISKMLIQGVFCTQIGTNYYLISDYSQQCYTYYHNLYTFTITIPLIVIWCFLIPLKIFFKLKSFQKLDHHRNPNGHKIENLLAYGILYDGYKNKFLYWEIFKIFHKFILMSIINLNINQQTQISLILLTNIFYYYLLQKAQPHKNIKQFQTEKRLIFKLLYTFALLQLTISDNSRLSVFKTIGLVFIFFINITTLKLAIFIFIGQIQIQIEEIDSCSNQFKKFLFKIKNKYPRYLKFLYIRRTKIIRIHQLWKKVIILFRKNMFTSKNFYNSKILNHPQQSESSQVHQPGIFKNHKSTSCLNSSNMLFSSNALGENINQNQLIPQSIQLIQLSNVHGIPSQDSPNNVQKYQEKNKFASKSLFKVNSSPGSNDQK
ncbi:hypothetical protein ABPG74_000808 [Tetrahymena malaccensis]